MKRVRYAAKMFALILLPVVACNRTPTQSTREPSSKAVGLIQGEYLSAPYIDQVTHTRSALAAGNSQRIDLIIVSRKGNRILLNTIFNFHEGGDQFAINQDGTVTPVGTGGVTVSNLNAVVLDNKTFQLGYGEYKPTKYVYVKDATEYVGRAVLVGKYKDGRGRRYEFREDGSAVFPERKFRFQIGLDHTLDHFDYFDERDENKAVNTWAFRRNGDTLEILRTRETENGFEEITDTRPVLSLHRIQ